MISLIIALVCNIYFANAEVIDIDNGNVVVLETDDGNVWAINGNGFEIGDKVTVKFRNNGTENIEDDSIVKIYAERETQ